MSMIETLVIGSDIRMLVVRSVDFFPFCCGQ